MAGFFKKIFSFGKPEPEPEKTPDIAEPALESPVDAAALPDFLRPEDGDTTPANELLPAHDDRPAPAALSPTHDDGPQERPLAEPPLGADSLEPAHSAEEPAATPPPPLREGFGTESLTEHPERDPADQPPAEDPEPPAAAPQPDVLPPDVSEPESEAVTPQATVEPGTTDDIPAPTPATPSPLWGGIQGRGLPASTPEPASTPSETAQPSPAPSQPSTRISVGKTVERRAEVAPVTQAPAPRVPWFQRLRDGLSRSSRELSGSIAGVFTRKKLDEETLQDLEDVLIRADLGVETAMRITDTLSSTRLGRDVSDAEVRAVMAAEIEKVLKPVAMPLELDLSHKPHVVLVVGVNGTGKTTTIGKLAAKLTAGGLKVTLAAGDTFRAAAIEQLKIWGERTGSEVVSSKLGADAAGLAWDAYEKAKANGSDVLIIDTAGRLQNKAELMAELEKIVRVLGRHDADAPHTVLQTVDATTGQNALNQVEIFRNVAGVNGLVMTKLDGTARGGILVGIAAKHRLPVYFIGVGEQVDDLEPFSAGDFAKAIAGV